MKTALGKFHAITGCTLQSGEGWHSSENVVRFFTPSTRVRNEATSRCDAFTTDYATMIHTGQRLFLLRAVKATHTLTELILAIWPLAHILAKPLIEAVLADHVRHPTSWPRFPPYGERWRSKGIAQCQNTSLFGPAHWQRRVGRCSPRWENHGWPLWM